MFANRYFGTRYFADRYFGQGGTGVAPSVLLLEIINDVWRSSAVANEAWRNAHATDETLEPF